MAKNRGDAILAIPSLMKFCKNEFNPLLIEVKSASILTERFVECNIITSRIKKNEIALSLSLWYLFIYISL
jgi:hypothetical protein